MDVVDDRTYTPEERADLARYCADTGHAQACLWIDGGGLSLATAPEWYGRAGSRGMDTSKGWKRHDVDATRYPALAARIARSWESRRDD